METTASPTVQLLQVTQDPLLQLHEQEAQLSLG